MRKNLIRYVLLLGGLIFIFNHTEAEKVPGYIVTSNADTLSGEIKIRKYNANTPGWVLNGFNNELLHYEVSFRGNGSKKFQTFTPDDIQGFGFTCKLKDYTYSVFSIESKSIFRNENKHTRFLLLEYDGNPCLYKDMVRVTNIGNSTKGSSYVRTDHYLYSDRTGLKKVEATDNIKSVADLLSLFDIDPDYIEGLSAQTSFKDIKMILDEYDTWHTKKNIPKQIQ